MPEQDHAALAAELSALLRLAVPPVGIAFRDSADTPGVAPIGGAAAGADRGRPHRRGRRALRLLVPRRRAGVLDRRRGPRQLQRRQLHPRLPAARRGRHKADVAALVQSGWVGEADFPRVPAVRDKPASIVYGPLDALPVAPDVVFLRLNAKQAMVLDDALGGVRFEGKPQCHVLAIAKDEQQPAISVGCMLSRVRTGMSNSEMSCAIPAAKLGETVEALRRNAEVERVVASLRRRRRGPLRRRALILPRQGPARAEVLRQPVVSLRRAPLPRPVRRRRRRRLSRGRVRQPLRAPGRDRRRGARAERPRPGALQPARRRLGGRRARHRLPARPGRGVPRQRRHAVRYGRALGCPKINCLAGIAPAGVDRAELDAVLVANLEYAAPRLADAGIRLLLEPINLRDIPGFFVSRTDHAERLLDAVGSD